MSPNKREQIYMSLNGHCAYCGKIMKKGDTADGNSPTVDHVLPRSDDGTDDSSNLLPCCGCCNSEKGSRTIEQYRVFCAKKINGFLLRAGLPLIDVSDVHFFFEGKVKRRNKGYKNFSRQPIRPLVPVELLEKIVEPNCEIYSNCGVEKTVDIKLLERRMNSLEDKVKRLGAIPPQINAFNRREREILKQIGELKKIIETK